MSLTYAYSVYDFSYFQPRSVDSDRPSLIGLDSGDFVILSDDGTSTVVNYRTESGSDILAMGFVPGGVEAVGVELADGNLAVATTDAGRVLYHILPAVGFGSFTSQPVSNAGTPDLDTSNADIAALTTGGFVIACQDEIGDGIGGDADIDLRFYNASGVEQRSLTLDTTVARDINPSVAVLDSGRVAVAWQRQTGTGTEIWMAVYDSAGNTVSPPALIDNGGSENSNPDVVAIDGGRFVILYQDNNWGTGGTDITMARFTGSGGLIGYENVSNPLLQTDVGNERAVQGVRLPGGHLAIIYTDDSTGDLDVGVRVMRQNGTFVSGTLFFDGLGALGLDQFDPNLVLAGQSGLAAVFDTVDVNLQGLRRDLRVAITSDAGADTITGTRLFEDFFGGVGDEVSYANSAQGVIIGIDSGQGTLGDAQGDTISGIPSLRGSQNADGLIGNAAANTFSGMAGDDTLQGNGGADRLDGGSGNDRLEGGLGNDIYIVDSTGDVIQGEAAFGSGGGIDTVFTSVSFVAPLNVEILRAQAGVAGIDLIGNDAPGTLVGNELSNGLNGRGGNDQINGNAGTDTLVGGEGADTLVGGLGADTFVYQAVSNSRAGAANRDVLNGFDRGATQDRIDLSAIDANSATALNDAFTFIGNAAFTAAGQVRIQSLGGPNAVIVEVNVNSALGADMQIFVNLTTTMVAGDFIL